MPNKVSTSKNMQTVTTPYPKTDALRYSLGFNHSSYSYPTTLIVLYEKSRRVWNM